MKIENQKSKIKNVAACVFAIFCLTLFGCGDDNTAGDLASSIVVSNPAALTQERFAEHREATSVVFTTSGAWTSTISENSGWISFDPKQGNEARQYTVTIAFMQNTTGEDRTAVFTIASGNDETTITVTQRAICSSGPCNLTPVCMEVVNDIALTQVLSAVQTVAQSVTFIAGEAWTSSMSEGDNSWITFAPQQGNAGQHSVAITLQPNTEDTDRTAIFTIKCGGGEERDITITQQSQQSQDPVADYFNRDWSILQTAREEAIAQIKEPLSTPAVHKILFVGCANTLFLGTSYTMDQRDRQFTHDVALNFKQVVEYWANYNVRIDTDVLFIERQVELPNTANDGATWVQQPSIQAELNEHAPVGAYDGVIVTGARTLSAVGRVHLGVKTAGYENLYGYCWYKTYVPTGNQMPPTTVPYTIPPATEAPFYSTNIAVHEWMHMHEFFEYFLDIRFPPTHAYQGTATSDRHIGYTQYPSHAVWDYAAYYRDVLGANVWFSHEEEQRHVGMFPHLWLITPRFLNSPPFYIVNEANGLYLTDAGDVTSFSNTPSPWHLRYNGKFNGQDRYMIFSPANRCLDINNGWSASGTVVNLRGVNRGYPHAQNWIITLNSDGTYKITTTFETVTEQRALSRNTATSPATATSIVTDNNSENQKWKILFEPL